MSPEQRDSVALRLIRTSFVWRGRNETTKVFREGENRESLLFFDFWDENRSKVVRGEGD